MQEAKEERGGQRGTDRTETQFKPAAHVYPEYIIVWVNYSRTLGAKYSATDGQKGTRDGQTERQTNRQSPCKA